jgi:peptidyl-prolyl cis-trans isomerase D
LSRGGREHGAGRRGTAGAVSPRGRHPGLPGLRGRREVPVAGPSAAINIAALARELKSLEQAGRQSNLEVTKSDWFSRSEPDKDLPALQGEARIKLFELEESRPFPEAPLMLANRYAVMQLLGRKVPEGALDKERPEITKRLLEEKQGILWQTWLDDERGKTQIEIYKEP